MIGVPTAGCLQVQHWAMGLQPKLQLQSQRLLPRKVPVLKMNNVVRIQCAKNR